MPKISFASNEFRRADEIRRANEFRAADKFGQQMNFGEQMTSEERKEWETLCRMYHVDSLYEAIQGCREELEFLVRCAERLEPRAEEE